MIMSMLESIGLKESIIIVLLFSAFVIITDEIIHARIRKRREASGHHGPKVTHG
jgi:hypothetical protein